MTKKASDITAGGFIVYNYLPHFQFEWQASIHALLNALRLHHPLHRNKHWIDVAEGCAHVCVEIAILFLLEKLFNEF